MQISDVWFGFTLGAAFSAGAILYFIDAPEFMLWGLCGLVALHIVNSIVKLWLDKPPEPQAAPSEGEG